MNIVQIVNMKKDNRLSIIIIVLLAYSFLGCKMYVKDAMSKNMEQTPQVWNCNINDSIKSLINDLIIDDKIEELNVLLSCICKKKKIDVKNWKIIYSNIGRLSPDNYIGYRLTVFYNLDFQHIIDVKEYRLEFFMAAVYMGDYDVLNLLDFHDDALNVNSCYGETVLTTAVRNNDVDMVRYLINRGVDKEKREYAACYDDAKEEKNGYEIAIELGYKEVADLLQTN